jgi:hypothetical protein
MKKKLKSIGVILLAGALGYGGYHYYLKERREIGVLRKVAERLSADSRVAEILVTGVNFDEERGQALTTIKFLEYSSRGEPLTPRYFTFTGNIIQFQSLVIRFDDIHIRRGDRLKGKSAYVFWKVFMLDGGNTQEYVINRAYDIPDGYKLSGERDPYEEKLWRMFWTWALDPDQAREQGIKNAQIEAPGTMFVPGNIYVIRIEHDGGLRIDVSPLSPILRGERIIS